MEAGLAGIRRAEAAQMFEGVYGPPPGWNPEDFYDEQTPRHRHVHIDREVVRLTYLMDGVFRIPVLGWRFGLNTIIDLIPGIGDTVTSVIALYILISALRYRVPKITALRMGLNVAFYYIVGLAPFIGDAVQTWWKPNRRNLRLLSRYATASPETALKARTSDKIFIWAIVLTLVSILIGSLVLGVLILNLLLQSMKLSLS